MSSINLAHCVHSKCVIHSTAQLGLFLLKVAYRVWKSGIPGIYSGIPSMKKWHTGYEKVAYRVSLYRSKKYKSLHGLFHEIAGLITLCKKGNLTIFSGALLRSGPVRLTAHAQWRGIPSIPPQELKRSTPAAWTNCVYGGRALAPLPHPPRNERQKPAYLKGGCLGI